MLVAHAPGEAHAVEKLQDLDGALAPQARSIAKGGRAYLAVGRLQLVGDLGDFAYCGGVVEKVVHDLEHFATFGRANQRATHERFRLRSILREIAHPGRVEARIEQLRNNAFDECALLGGGRRVVFRQMQPWPTLPQSARREQVRDQRAEQRAVQPWKRHALQASNVGAQFVGVIAMKSAKGFLDLRLQGEPLLFADDKVGTIASHRSRTHRLEKACGVTHVAAPRKERQVHAARRVRDERGEARRRRRGLECREIRQALRGPTVA